MMSCNFGQAIFSVHGIPALNNSIYSTLFFWNRLRSQSTQRREHLESSNGRGVQSRLNDFIFSRIKGEHYFYLSRRDPVKSIHLKLDGSLREITISRKPYDFSVLIEPIYINTAPEYTIQASLVHSVGRNRIFVISAPIVFV